MSFYLRSGSISFILFIFSHFFRCISSFFLKCNILFSASVMCLFPLSSCLLLSDLSGRSLFFSLGFFSFSTWILFFSAVGEDAAGISGFGGSASATGSTEADASSSSSSISPSSKSISSCFSLGDSSWVLLLNHREENGNYNKKVY